MPGQPNQIPAEIRNRYLLLWDGQCDFCKRSVEWLHKKASDKFVPLPYQEQKTWLPSEIYSDSKNQFYLRSPQGEYLGGGDAVIKLFEVMGWKIISRLLGLPGLRQLTKIIYQVVAKNRDFLSRFLFRAT